MRWLEDAFPYLLLVAVAVGVAAVAWGLASIADTNGGGQPSSTVYTIPTTFPTYRTPTTMRPPATMPPVRPR